MDGKFRLSLNISNTCLAIRADDGGTRGGKCLNPGSACNTARHRRGLRSSDGLAIRSRNVRIRIFLQAGSYSQDNSVSILRFLKIVHDGFESTACWTTINPTGAAHRLHCYPNNFLSGAYYVQTQPDADTINCHDPRIQRYNKTTRHRAGCLQHGSRCGEGE